MKPQSADVLNLLRAHPEGITPMVALTEARCMRLAARIADLRADGFCIEADLVPVGRGKRVALYRLIETRQLALAL